MKNAAPNRASAGSATHMTCASFSGNSASKLSALLVFLSGILSISGCTGLTGASKLSSSPSTPSAATISMVPASVNFGSVAVGSTASQSVIVKNGGGSTLTVTQASSTASGFAVTGISFPLSVAAGIQATFNIVFAPMAAGTVTGELSVMSNASSAPSTVALTGTGMAATAFLAVSAPSLNFGSVPIGGSSILSLSLTNSGNSNVTVSNVTLSGAPYSEGGVPNGLILTPGQSATMNVTFAPLAAGTLPGSVTIVSNATNSPVTVSFSGAGTQSVSHSVALAWTASVSTVSGYNVYRSGVSGGPYTKLNSLDVPADAFTDSSVLSGQTYFYVVTSVTSAGVESADSGQVSATIP